MDKEKIMQVLKIRGPLLPIDIAKALNTNSIMAGALLSELVSNKRVKISHLKVGGSPLYYVEGQEHKLQNYPSSLKGPEKDAFKLLKERKLLKDSELQPAIRVALRNIKDFAKPIEITMNSHKELFWKWYLTKNEDLQALLSPKKEPESQKEEVKQEQRGEPKEVKEEPKRKVEAEPKEEKIEREPREEIKEEIKEEKKEPQKDVSSQDQNSFSEKISQFFHKNNISIISQKIIRSTEIEYQVLLPSAVGKILYYVVAKSKKKCTDADLSQAYVKGEMNKLPVLFVHTGDLTKKAKEMLKHEFKIITDYKI